MDPSLTLEHGAQIEDGGNRLLDSAQAAASAQRFHIVHGEIGVGLLAHLQKAIGGLVDGRAAEQKAPGLSDQQIQARGGSQGIHHANRRSRHSRAAVSALANVPLSEKTSSGTAPDVPSASIPQTPAENARTEPAKCARWWDFPGSIVQNRRCHPHTARDGRVCVHAIGHREHHHSQEAASAAVR